MLIGTAEWEIVSLTADFITNQSLVAPRVNARLEYALAEPVQTDPSFLFSFDSTISFQLIATSNRIRTVGENIIKRFVI